MYTVAIYLIDQAYGGPEEGGWWFTCGEPIFEDWTIPYTRHYNNEDEACNAARRLNEGVVAEMNVGKPDISSVASEGRYEARVIEGYDLKPFPAQIPHYE